MHMLHKRYTSFQWAATYANVCEPVSNVHVTYMNVCITYMLRMSNICLTYKQYVGMYTLEILCMTMHQRMPRYGSVPVMMMIVQFRPYCQVWRLGPLDLTH